MRTPDLPTDAVGFRLPTDIRQQCEEVARKEGLTFTEMLRTAMRRVAVTKSARFIYDFAEDRASTGA